MKVKLLSGTKRPFEDYYTLTFSLTTHVGDEALASLRMGKEFELKELSECRKRSLDANAYFHVLVGKIADVVRESRVYIKNYLLSQYGQAEIVDGEMLTLKSKVEPHEMMLREDIHLSPIGYEFDSWGTVWNIYRVMKPTHTYHSKEFSILLNHVVEDAKDLGIEVLPPAELERMMSAWKA